MPLFLILALLLASLCAPRAGAAQAEATERIAVTATPVPLDPRDPSRTVVGRLRYLGGLHLTSPDRRFGGLSGLRWHDGQLFAVSDQGDFFRFTPEERDGRLTGVSDVRVRRLARPDGRPLEGKEESDAEALEVTFKPLFCAEDPCFSADAVVAFEGTNRLWMYRLVDGLPEGAPAELAWSSEWRRGLPRNGGVEAMAGGYLLSEELREPDGSASGRLTRWIGEARTCMDSPCPGSSHGQFRREETPVNLPVADGFAPTDAVETYSLPDSPIFVLQRRYTPAEGASARIVWFHVSRDEGRNPIPGRLAGLETLAELAPPLTVDNMEGLAYSDSEGDFLYVISDDNFSPRQRTLLLKFELIR